MEWIIPVVTLLTILLSVSGSAWALRGSVYNEFSKVKDNFYVRLDSMEQNILDKLEYHERHDDRRFDNVNNDLLTIKLRNAAIDGLKTYGLRSPEEKTDSK